MLLFISSHGLVLFQRNGVFYKNELLEGITTFSVLFFEKPHTRSSVRPNPSLHHQFDMPGLRDKPLHVRVKQATNADKVKPHQSLDNLRPTRSPMSPCYSQECRLVINMNGKE
jgi:hypothetical protein